MLDIHRNLPSLFDVYSIRCPERLPYRFAFLIRHLGFSTAGQFSLFFSFFSPLFIFMNWDFPFISGDATFFFLVFLSHLACCEIPQMRVVGWAENGHLVFWES
ncbi:hypothetical protein BDW42DRAFT_41313 [Aspergillus taichungensis]|uniref:Uncharacterized protein n=1 Tax=Aspergillus taichungensis TaxID=482145 RepID=A0A2J5I3W4_9EURO|nr:hypothetical protein BDW42DRAFT_41313 [Aspergillus taichungensis]